MLIVGVVQARNLRGSKGPTSGGRNPYLSLVPLDAKGKQVRSEAKQTATLADTREPQWDEVFAFGLTHPIEECSALQIKVKDWTPSVSSSHTWLGQVLVPLETLVEAVDAANADTPPGGPERYADQWFRITTRADARRRQVGPAQGDLRLLVYYYPGPPLDPQPLGAVLHVVGGKELRGEDGQPPQNPYVRACLTARDGTYLTGASKFKTRVRGGAGADPEWFEAVFFKAQGVTVARGDPEETALEEVGLSRSGEGGGGHATLPSIVGRGGGGGGPTPAAPARGGASSVLHAAGREKRFLSHITEASEAAASHWRDALPRHPPNLVDAKDSEAALLQYGPMVRRRAGASAVSLAKAHVLPIAPARSGVMSAVLEPRLPAASSRATAGRRSQTWATEGAGGADSLEVAAAAALGGGTSSPASSPTSRSHSVTRSEAEPTVALAEHKLRQVGDPYLDEGGQPIFWLRYPDAVEGGGDMAHAAGLRVDVRMKQRLGAAEFGHVLIRWSTLFGDASTVLTSHGLRCDRWWPVLSGVPQGSAHQRAGGQGGLLVGYLRLRLELFYPEAYLPLGWEEGMTEEGEVYWTHITAMGSRITTEPASVKQWRAANDLGAEESAILEALDGEGGRDSLTRKASTFSTRSGRAMSSLSTGGRLGSLDMDGTGAGGGGAALTRKYFLAANGSDAGSVPEDTTPLAAVTAQRRTSRQPDALSAAVVDAQVWAGQGGTGAGGGRGRNDSVIFTAGKCVAGDGVRPAPARSGSMQRSYSSGKRPPPAPPRGAVPTAPPGVAAAPGPGAARQGRVPPPGLAKVSRPAMHVAHSARLALSKATLLAELAHATALQACQAALRHVGARELSEAEVGPPVGPALLAAACSTGAGGRGRPEFVVPGTAGRASMVRGTPPGQAKSTRQVLPGRASTSAGGLAAIGGGSGGRKAPPGLPGKRAPPGLASAAPSPDAEGSAPSTPTSEASSAPAEGTAAEATPAEATPGEGSDSEDAGEDEDVLQALPGMGADGGVGEREVAFFDRMRQAKAEREKEAAQQAAKAERMTEEEAAAAAEEAARKARHEKRKGRMIRQSIVTYGGGANKRNQLLSRRGRGRGRAGKA